MDPVSLYRHAATILGVSVPTTTIQTGCSMLDQCVLSTTGRLVSAVFEVGTIQVLLPAFHVPSKTPNTVGANTHTLGA